jgi:hypothetical protein
VRVLRIWTGGSKDRTSAEAILRKAPPSAAGLLLFGSGVPIRPSHRRLARWLGSNETAVEGPGLRYGSIMGPFKLMASAIRRIVRFPLFQFAVVVAIVLLLQAADEHSLVGWISDELDQAVAATVSLCSNLFSVKSFTRSGLTLFLTVAYVYVALAIAMFVLRAVLRGLIDLVAWSNALGLRNAIARERGIAAYRAWVPFERIRPASIPQEQWEQTFAWPANNQPPYPSLPYRFLRTAAGYVLLFLIMAVLLQLCTPIPFLAWLAALTRMVLNRAGLAW